MGITVQELMTALQEQLDADAISADTEIRFASQPNYPLEYALSSNIAVVNFVSPENLPEDESDDDRDTAGYCADDNHPEGASIVYLSEGLQVGYLPGAIAESVGWGGR